MEKAMGGEFPVETEWLGERDRAMADIAFASGRCALYAILNDISKEDKCRNRRLSVPDFLCASVTRTVSDAGWKYSFYSVGYDFLPDDSSIFEVETILLINYFGMTDVDSAIRRIRESNRECIIIVDGVQAFYTENYAGADYVFFSYRKWFACPDGAHVRKNMQGGLREIPLGANHFAQYKLAGNLLKTFSEDISENVFLPLLETGEGLLDQEYLCECSSYTKQFFQTIEFEEIACRRRENARYLHEELQALGIRHFYAEQGVPLFVPIMVENRDGIRKHFFEHQIFTPVHWPVLGREWNGDNAMYRQELSLICDQRYDIEDMKRQTDVLKRSGYHEEFVAK